MTTAYWRAGRFLASALAVLPAMAVLAIPASLLAQAEHGKGETRMQAQEQSLEQRLNALQEQVAILESALKRGHKSAPASTSAGPGHSGMGMGGMKAGETGGMGMGGMKAGEMGGMGMGGMKAGEMGGMGMGGMKMSPSASMASAQPGQPGTSHLLHVGSTGFFLDHPEHIELSREQQTRLNQMREAWQLKNADMQRGVEQAEQEIWTATAGADSVAIESAVQKAEKLRSAQRLAFVRSVVEASTVLTQEQEDVLLGVAPKAN